MQQWALDNEDNKDIGENTEERDVGGDPKEATEEVDQKQTESTDVTTPAVDEEVALEDPVTEGVNETSETAEEEEAPEEAPVVKVSFNPSQLPFIV